MKIIAIDSSGLVASVAIWEDGIIVAEYTTNYKKTHSQTLLPMLDEVSKMTLLDMKEVDAIAVAAGPGSYTGLRIGAATAKGIAYSLGKPIIPVSTLDGLAYNFWGCETLICPLMDARRGQVYAGIYEIDDDGKLIEVLEKQATMIDEVIGKINQLGKKVVFLGDGACVYKELLEAEVKAEMLFAPAHRNYQSAASVATLAARYYDEGKFIRSEDFAPEYLRKSQAENEGPQDFRI